MALEGKKVLFIIAPGNFRDEEFEVPFKLISNAGASIKVASTTTHKSTGTYGAEITPDLTIYEVIPLDFNAIVFVGGSGSSIYFDDQTAHTIAREAFNNHRIVAAICIAVATLANAGILTNKRVTAFESVMPIVQRGGAMYTGTPVQRDGMLLTAIGPSAAKQFGEELISMLGDGQ